jgi:hypothetical protein
MRHLGQGKDIARGEFVPDIPRARGAKVLFLVDLGCREGAPVWSARHGISGSILLLRWMVGRCLRWWLMRARESWEVAKRNARAVTFSIWFPGRVEALGASVGFEFESRLADGSRSPGGSTMVLSSFLDMTVIVWKMLYSVEYAVQTTRIHILPVRQEQNTYSQEQQTFP